MLRHVDDALRALFAEQGDLPDETEIVFEAPTTEWAASRARPTLDVYLYDIREDLDRRHTGVIPVVDDDHRVVERHPPPRFYRLSYLVTAWTERAEDEHSILDGVFTCLLRRDHLPPELLENTPVSLGYPARLEVALPPPEDRSLSDVWSALGGQLKPTLDVVVSAPIDTGRGGPVDAPPPDRATIGPPADAHDVRMVGVDRRSRRWRNGDDTDRASG